MNQTSLSDSRHKFWNDRATAGIYAGTRDVMAKRLEMKAIGSFVRDGMRILDFGCGNGITALEIARKRDVEILGIDYAEQMIAASRQIAKARSLRGRVTFQVGDVSSLEALRDSFDLIFTERMIINLPDWPAQLDAIRRIAAHLKPGGTYAMLENSQDGVDRLNAWRRRLGLAPVIPPWHNRYLRDAEVRAAAVPGMKLERVWHYSSTYYFASRVLNGKLAQLAGKEPDYDSLINRFALKLPAIGRTSQGRLWVWRKA